MEPKGSLYINTENENNILPDSLNNPRETKELEVHPFNEPIEFSN